MDEDPGMFDDPPQEEEAPAQDGKTTNTEPIKGTSGTTYK